MADKLTSSLQESLLTLLCMDDEHGGIAAGLVDAELFDPPYDDIAARALRYRKKFKQAPGKAHIDDLFDHILSDKKNKRRELYQQVLGGIIEQSDGLNAVFVLTKVSEFTRSQHLRSAILEAAERFDRGGDDTLLDAENILQGALKFKPQDVQRGIYLSDKRSIDYMTEMKDPDYYLGVKPFDNRGVGLTRREALGFLANKGKGKTWACVHVGVQGIMQGARVLHVSLEMSERRILPRYLKRLFAIANNREKIRETVFELDELKRVTGFDFKSRTPKVSIKDDDLDEIIARKMTALGTRLDRLHVKAFPTSSLTMGGLNAYIDSLFASDGFLPDIIILDYPKLMSLDRRQDLRIALGLRMEELRGFLAERNAAGFFPFQASREGEDQPLLTGKFIGEDYSIGQTVDNMLTYNQTKDEKALGLARLYADKVRNERDGFAVLITQDYGTGQFVKSAAVMPNDYQTILKSAA